MRDYWNCILIGGLACVAVLCDTADRTPLAAAAGVSAAARPLVYVVTPSQPAEATLQLKPGRSKTYHFLFPEPGQYQFVIEDDVGQDYSVTWTYTDFEGSDSHTNEVNGGGQLNIGIMVPDTGIFQVTVQNLAERGDPANTYDISAFYVE